METALEKLVKVLELERQGGHRNHAVVGGVQRYIPVWIEQARAQADAEAEKALVEQVGELLTDYGQLAGPAARAKLVDAVQERLERAIAVRSAPPDPVEQATEPHLPSAETKAPARPIGPAPAPPDQAATMPAQPRETGRPVEAARHPDPPPSQVDHDAPSGLDAPITTLRGVGPRTAEQLQKLGLNTIGDMLAFYPRRYVDYSALKPISRLEYGEQVTIIGTVWETSVPRAKSRRKIVRSIIGDGTGTIECTWFNQPWLANKLKAGTAMMISGKVDRYLGRLTFQSPEWELVDKEQLHTGRTIGPVEPQTPSRKRSASGRA
jgi:ATP-dependent DNA helicase RecG